MVARGGEPARGRLLLLLWALGAGPALGRELPRPPDDSEPHLLAGAPPPASNVQDRPSDGDPWDPAVAPVPAGELPLGPALHGPRAASGAPREGPGVTDDLQMARGPSSPGWTGPPDSQEPAQPEAPGAPPQPALPPTAPTARLGGATAAPSPEAPAGLQPPREEGVSGGAGTRAPETPPRDPQGPPDTLGAPLGTPRSPPLEARGGETFHELARGPPLTQQGPAAPEGGPVSPVEAESSAEPDAQPGPPVAGSRPPPQKPPAAPPRKDGGVGESSPSPPTQPADARGPPAAERPEAPEVAKNNSVDPISPQRVRGAVGSPGTPKSLIPDLPDPGPAPNRTDSPKEALQPDDVEEWPRRPQSHPPAPPVQAPSTSRRGLIRVTTQRALGQPGPPEPSASSMAPVPVSSPPANATAPPLRWGPLRRVLSFAWELHVYGVGVLFLLPALLALATLAAAPGGPRPALAAAALVLVAGALRSAYMLADPYGSQARLGARAGLVLYNLPFPLLVAALGALAQLGLGAGLPLPLQRPLLLAALAAAHGAILLATDLLSPRPVLNLLAQGVSCAWGAAVALGTLCLCRRRLLAGPRAWDARPGPRLLAVAGSLGLLACGLQLAAALWLYPGPGRVGRFSWAWWGVHFWLRLLELTWALALALAAVAAARPRPPTEHACWTKLLRLACPAPAGKSEVPERPNNCYAGPSGAGVGGLELGRSLIRNAAELGPSSPGTWGSAAALSRSSGGPAPSLSELDLQPPSPINLSRSIDAALFREHLVRDSVFRRRGLASSPPGGALRPRRGSHPDGPDGAPAAPPPPPPRARCRSLDDVRAPAPASTSAGSPDSGSRGSLHISWNPWRHGLSSADSLPLDAPPSTARLLPTPAPAPAPPPRARPPRAAPGDSRSASSDTIEL
ncbi:proline-rich transmembrane protein 3 isoform X2 [Sorex araneus]|nr:proline-rich transmembrane protein 3 isoform X2 [Sorex araneus]XP_054990783.1 proline-rich transmembrane protein 3 isoform X2 [Sorex araneus]XP_054990784.1 proline-rich transmembrane protein 3 isoform X2 [Sorex araneus]